MAKLEWKTPIEAVHGKLYKKFGAAKRKTPNKTGDQPNYSVFYGERTTTPDEDELAARAKFSAVSKLVGQRRKNVSQRITDAAAFKAQTACPTLTSYLWSVCTAEYEASLEND